MVDFLLVYLFVVLDSLKYIIYQYQVYNKSNQPISLGHGPIFFHFYFYRLFSVSPTSYIESD